MSSTQTANHGHKFPEVSSYLSRCQKPDAQKWVFSVQVNMRVCAGVGNGEEEVWPAEHQQRASPPPALQLFPIGFPAR